MSWSTAASGSFGLVSDAHRVGIVFDVDVSTAAEVDKGLLSALYDISFRHFLFKVHRGSKAWDDGLLVANLLKYLTHLRHLGKTPNPLQDASLYVTLVCDIADEGFLRMCFDAVASDSEAANVDCLVVDLSTLLGGVQLSSSAPATFTSHLARVPELSAVLVGIKKCVLACKSKDSAPFFLGIDGIYDRGILQLLFEEPIGKELALVLPGSIKLPNIKTRLIDFIHSRGANTMHLPTNDTLLNSAKSEDQAPVLRPLLKKYPQCKTHAAPIIVKVLSQLGVVVGVSHTLGFEFLRDMIAPVIHPFANRKEFVAPSITKRFVVDFQDVENLKAESEEIECQEDEVWRKAYLYKVPTRTPTDQVPREES